MVPRRDDPVEVLPHDGILARFDDGAELRLGERATARALEQTRHENDHRGEYRREERQNQRDRQDAADEVDAGSPSRAILNRSFENSDVEFAGFLEDGHRDVERMLLEEQVDGPK